MNINFHGNCKYLQAPAEISVKLVIYLVPNNTAISGGKQYCNITDIITFAPSEMSSILAFNFYSMHVICDVCLGFFHMLSKKELSNTSVCSRSC